MKNRPHSIDAQVQDVAGSVALHMGIIKEPNTATSDNDVSKLIFCTE